MDKSALHCQYVIGGVPQDMTPAEILDSVSGTGRAHGDVQGVLVDEVIDPAVPSFSFDPALVDRYADAVCSAGRRFPFAFSGTHSRTLVASALIDTLWEKGHFRIGDLSLAAVWKWDMAPVGAAAAFYESVRSVADYVDLLDLKLDSYSLEDGESGLCISPLLASGGDSDEDIFVRQAFTSDHPWLEAGRMCPQTIQPEPQDWLVYVPMETSDFRLGGSLLAQTQGVGGGVTPQISDADYFIDCYEVLRELVEDGVVIAGATVGEGGLLKALRSMSAGGSGIHADISGIMKSYEEHDIVRVLFSEVPGVIIQIHDIDFDYLDAELLLQDVAYFPLGHPVEGCPEVKVDCSGKSGIQRILESLIQNAEGED